MEIETTETMNPPTQEGLGRLEIERDKKARRKAGPVVMIALVAGVLIIGLVVLLTTRKADRQPIPSKGMTLATAASAPVAVAPAKSGEPVLTVSGYVIPRQRI